MGEGRPGQRPAPLPLGNRLRPCLAHTRDSLRGGPAPGPVGAFPADTSTVGATDLAGGVREWTRTSAPGGRVVRGGSWQDDRRDARLASRHIHPDDACDPRVGFRLVREGP